MGRLLYFLNFSIWVHLAILLAIPSPFGGAVVDTDRIYEVELAELNPNPASPASRAPAQRLVELSEIALSVSDSPPIEEGATPYLEEEVVDLPPRLLNSPQVEYPSMALKQGFEADVRLLLLIAADGQVVEAAILDSAGEEFDEAARRTALALRFSPAQKANTPVSVQLRWTCRFRLT